MADPLTSEAVEAATSRLHAARHLDAASLLPLVYAELRRLAAFRLSRLPPGQTLAATELVHEAFGKLARAKPGSWENDRHFVRAAGVAMRCVLIDRIRARGARRRHVADAAAGLEGGAAAGQISAEDQFSDLHHALERLEAVDARAAEVVTLKVFLGLQESNIARALDVSERTVRRDWAFAKTWLESELARSRSQSDGSS